MIDFLKLDISHALWDPSKIGSLDFVSGLNRATGELQSRQIHEGDHWHVVRYPDSRSGTPRIILTGSIHKGYCSGFNYSDFGYNDLVEALADLCLKFGINPYKCRILTLEIGANIHLPNAQVLVESLYFMRGRSSSFVDMTNSNHRAIGRELDGEDHRVKLYNKSRQLAKVATIGPDLIRYEDHYTRLRTVTGETGTSTVADLFHLTKVQRLADRMLNNAGKLVFVGEQNPPGSPEAQLYERWSNPLDLNQLRCENPRKFRSELRRYQIVNQRNTESLYSRFISTLRSKTTRLLTASPESVKTAKIWLRQFESVPMF